MPADETGLVFVSGECEVDLSRRELRVRGAAIPVGSRAFEIIVMLSRAPGKLVTKDDLLDSVWPGAAVPDNTLQVHISAVRRALGPHRGLLKTEAGRGYRLLGDWSRRSDVLPAAEATTEPAVWTDTSSAAPRGNLPAAAYQLVGRDQIVRHLLDLTSAYRVVTLTGPGGIGKTALALEIARDALASFPDGAWLVELAALTEPDLVPSAIAGILGPGAGLGADRSSADTVARRIGGKEMLLVLDNCEHVVDAVANLAETIVRMCPQATLLVTSREVLRIEGEHVYRVPALDVPPSDHDTPESILEHSATELFVARARASDSEFLPDATNLAAIAAICRQLDGIPLAIEFAAARAATLGPMQVAARLDDRFSLLTGGRRTALPRHRTLRAALDWSYDLLSADEQCLLRRIAVFAGGFSLDAAIFVLRDNVSASSATDGISNLVSKSLVTLTTTPIGSRWRLLETIRAYALEKLTEAGETALAARRHAEYHQSLCTRARGDWETEPTGKWLEQYAPLLGDIRAALDWAFGVDGDPTLGMTLTVDTVPLWMQLSLMRECRANVERALAHVGPATRHNARLRLRLNTTLSLSRMYTRDRLSDIEAAWAATHALAQELDDPDYQLRALWGLFAVRFNSADFPAALELAGRFRELAKDPNNQLIGERLTGTALHFLGDQQRAQQHIEHMLGGYVPPASSAHIIRFQNDQVIAARRVLAPILWL
ncbi:MAG TPA: winged helix-turn-helix domain-containing protein, partial [Stellaceae bacterium]|nr:winged helix-turn-helix domain-containing protein [Stellaceae bacterium]